MRRLLLVALLLCTAAARPRPADVIPWAWERPEDLRFLGKRPIAYLALTITLDGDDVVERPRLQPLRVADGAPLIAVVRIEALHPSLTPRQRHDTAAAIANVAKDRAALQIDFDARQSQRAFYAALLREVRDAIPRDMPLSITALASWCLDDAWVDALPIDDAVPMLFRMGSDDAAVRARLARGGDFTSERCRASVGISLDEPLPSRPRGRRLFVFNPKPWTESAWRDIR